MITAFFAGYFFALISSFFLATRLQKYAVKKGWFASAVWSEKEKTWKVRGSYLGIATKILRGIRKEPGANKVQYVD